MLKRILSAAALAGIVFVNSGASAVTWYLQPASGRPWVGSGTPSVFSNTYNTGTVTIFDTQVCSYGDYTTSYWITDVAIDLTNTTYSAVQDRSRFGGNVGVDTYVKTRLVSFNPSGTVYSSSAFTDNASIGSVVVPTNGTLFVQSQLRFTDYDPDVSGEHACLRSVRVTR